MKKKKCLNNYLKRASGGVKLVIIEHGGALEQY